MLEYHVHIVLGHQSQNTTQQLLRQITTAPWSNANEADQHFVC